MAKYINTNLTSNGDGTLATPYNSFTEVNALTGALSGEEILIHSGTDTRLMLSMLNASDFSIGAYGGSARPLIRGSDIIVSSWSLDVSNGFYYLSGQTLNHGLFVDGERIIDAATVDELVGITQWWDSVTDRIYISFNPTGHEFEITTREACVLLTTCSNYIVRDVILEKADDSNMSAALGCDDSRFYNIESRNAGGWRDNTGRNGFLLKGTSSNIATGVNMKNCISNYNQNCGAELHYMNGAEFNENSLLDNSNGYELWQGMDSNLFKRNRIEGSSQIGTSTGHGNGFWVAADNQSGNGNNPNNTFAYNIIKNTDSPSFAIEDGVGQLIYNNTIHHCGTLDANTRALFIAQGGTIPTGATIKNNTIVMNDETVYAIQVGKSGDLTATDLNTVFADNQLYYNNSLLQYKFQIGVTTYQNADAETAFDLFKAALNTPDITSDYGDPLFVNAIDFELGDSSPCISTGSDVGEVIDFNKYPIYGLPDKGAVEKKIMKDVKSGFSSSL